MTPTITPPSKPVIANPKTLTVLSRLHEQSSAQEKSWSIFSFYLSKYLRSFFTTTKWASRDDDFMRDKFIALEPEKCEFVYLLARAIGAKNIVEAGTSFGVSTIYLALAAGQNVREASPAPGRAPGGRVFATEKEPSKANRAREHWKEMGDEVEPWVSLLEGNLLETLPVALSEHAEPIDLLLLDSMCGAFHMLHDD